MALDCHNQEVINVPEAYPCISLTTDEGKIKEHAGGVMKRSILIGGDAVNIVLAINHHITNEESCRSWNAGISKIVICCLNAVLGMEPNGISS
jgi:hypothetical protein